MTEIWTCESNVKWDKIVPASDGRGLYLVEWVPTGPGEPVSVRYKCECKSFKYRDGCKHIDHIVAYGMRCQWNHELDATAEVEMDFWDAPRCPKCKGPVVKAEP